MCIYKKQLGEQRLLRANDAKIMRFFWDAASSTMLHTANAAESGMPSFPSGRS